MSTYKVSKVGHDEALEDLTDISPQPTSEGIQPTRRTFAASSDVYDEGKYVELRFSTLGSAADYRTLLHQFGVRDARTAPVTVYVRDEVYNWSRMNGTAVRPEPGQDVRWAMPFPRNIVILVKDLETAA